jgi:hypothetical protein
MIQASGFLWKSLESVGDVEEISCGGTLVYEVVNSRQSLKTT